MTKKEAIEIAIREMKEGIEVRDSLINMSADKETWKKEKKQLKQAIKILEAENGN